MPAKRITFLVTLETILFLTLPSPALAALPPAIPEFVPDPGVNQNLVTVLNQGLGQCWWTKEDLLAKDFVSWSYDVGYSWRIIEPQEGGYDFSYYEESLATSRRQNKGYLLYFLTGQTDEKGERTPPWLIAKIQANHPQNWIKEAHLVAPWDPDWQAALDKLAKALAEKYDQDPHVIGVVVPSGCRYGEMSCWCGGEERKSWERAGYTDEKFTQAVEQTVDAFLKYFQNKPVVVQIGGGLNGQRASTGYKLMAEMFAKYGLRVRYKFNGWGDASKEVDVGTYYKGYGGYTAVGYEVGVEENFDSPATAKSNFDNALSQHVTFSCLGNKLLSKTGDWENQYRYFSRYLGTQIVLNSASFSPSQVAAAQPVSLQTSFTNRGTKPLVAAKRVGVKDEPATYHLAVYFIHQTTGQETRRLLTPPTPTNQWYGGRGQPAYPISGSVNAPEFGGTYEIRIALENTYDGPHEGEAWAYVTNQSDDGRHRYLLGSILVTGDNPPPTTRLSLGRNVLFWDQPEIWIADLWQRFPGTIWLSQLIDGIWKTVVKSFGQETGNVVTNTTFTITQSSTNNT